VTASLAGGAVGGARRTDWLNDIFPDTLIRVVNEEELTRDACSTLLVESQHILLNFVIDKRPTDQIHIMFPKGLPLLIASLVMALIDLTRA
jgi:hypothetical protein